MQKFPFRRFQGIFACTAGLVLILLLAACSGVSGGSTGQAATGTTATTNPVTAASATSVPPTATHPPAPTAPPVASTAFKAGGISFIGPVKSITGSNLTMSAPNGQTVTMAITAQTDRSAFGGSLPTVGASVDMDSVANPDGSFVATIVKPAVQGDPDLNVIAYTGITTSAVGADRVLHFTAGVKSYTFTLPSTSVLSDFSGNAQAIGNNTSVKVKVQFPANTVVSVGNPNAGS